MDNRYFAFLILFLYCVGACQNVSKPIIDEDYTEEIESWRADRRASLKAPDGWPALVGLFRLKDGENTVGSDSQNDLVFPSSAPPKMGVIELKGDSIINRISTGVSVAVKNSAASQEVAMSVQNPLILTHGALSWYPIKRGDSHFIRLRDTLSAARLELGAIPHFPLDARWRIRAKFLPFDPPRTIPVRNVLDMDIDQNCEGKLQFEWEGQTHEIWVLDGGDEQFFLIIADETTGEETYGGGRYMYVPRPDADGYTIVDFNKAYNPPCVFTKYATCLLPPAQNRLTLAIRAGEMMYGEQH